MCFASIQKGDLECNGSVTAGEGRGGVRPSSGAAMLESGRDIMKSGASAHSGLAAPEDGRTPIPSSPPPLTHYPARHLGLDHNLPDCTMAATMVGNTHSRQALLERHPSRASGRGVHATR